MADPSSGDGRSQLALGLFELGEGLGVVDHVRVEPDLADLGPGLGDGGICFLLEIGRPFDRFHQVRDQVRPPLVHVFNLAPFRPNVLIEPVEAVVNAGDPKPDDDRQNDDDAQDAEGAEAALRTRGSRDLRCFV